MMHEPKKAFQFMGGICPGGTCPGGICPGGICPGGICPGGMCPRGYMSKMISVQEGIYPGVSVHWGWGYVLEPVCSPCTQVHWGFVPSCIGLGTSCWCPSPNLWDFLLFLLVFSHGIDQRQSNWTPNKKRVQCYWVESHRDCLFQDTPPFIGTRFALIG